MNTFHFDPYRPDVAGKAKSAFKAQYKDYSRQASERVERARQRGVELQQKHARQHAAKQERLIRDEIANIAGKTHLQNAHSYGSYETYQNGITRQAQRNVNDKFLLRKDRIKQATNNVIEKIREQDKKRPNQSHNFNTQSKERGLSGLRDRAGEIRNQQQGQERSNDRESER